MPLSYPEKRKRAIFIVHSGRKKGVGKKSDKGKRKILRRGTEEFATRATGKKERKPVCRKEKLMSSSTMAKPKGRDRLEGKKKGGKNSGPFSPIGKKKESL